MGSETIKRSFSQRLKDFLGFLKSPWFLKRLIIYVAIIILSVVSVFLWLKFYTRHGQQINVPELRTMDEQTVAKICESRGLRYEIIDSVYTSTAKPGAVVEQNPPANFKVKKDRIIFLTIKAYTAEKTLMPALVGVHIVQARADLETAGLGIGRLSYRSDIAKDNVLEQRLGGKIIAPGTSIDKGSRIDLVLGTGEGDDNAKTSVPDLLGLGLESAGLMAAGSSLNIGVALFDETVVTAEDSLKAVVYKQSPRVGRAVNAGTEIDVWLTTDPDKVEAEENAVQPSDEFNE